MTQTERRQYLIRSLLEESPSYKTIPVPTQASEQRSLLRGLMNVRTAAPISAEFERIQDLYLREEAARKGTISLEDLTPMQAGLYLWRGDITRLRCGAIVNAANSGMTGCYQPCHNCIDNCIHTWAGIQLRNACQELMDAQGHPEPTGQAKLTSAYNLPCDYVIHTVGPIVDGALTQRHRDLLASCYRACLTLAEEQRIQSIAFCCISTGVFRFPREEAAEIAVDTVKTWLAETGSRMAVIFNVHGAENEAIYRRILTAAS